MMVRTSKNGSELFLNNKEYLLKSLEQFEEQFHLLKESIKNNDEESLKTMFKESSKRRENLEK